MYDYHPPVVGFCHGCGGEISPGNAIRYLHGCTLHDNAECARQYIVEQITSQNWDAVRILDEAGFMEGIA